MKLATWRRQGRERFGAVIEDAVVDLAPLADDVASLLAAGANGVDAARELCARDNRRIAVADVEWLPPVPRPGKIVCVGLNYRSHLALLDEPAPEYPILFTKPTTSLTPHGGAIVLPHVSTQVDYEGELAVVIGTRGKYVSESDALHHVGGYACANDVSAHDIEFRTSQWTSGKMLDTFCPLGPWIVTADEIANPNDLRLKTTINGETVQDESTSDMLFSVPALVSYISSLTTLEPGDVILTGTPAGLGCMRQPQLFLRPGDTITVSIGGIGSLTNLAVAEGSPRC